MRWHFFMTQLGRTCRWLCRWSAFTLAPKSMAVIQASVIRTDAVMNGHDFWGFWVPIFRSEHPKNIPVSEKALYLISMEGPQ